MLRYQEQESRQTLAEGLMEYWAANPGLNSARDPGGSGAEFFRCHDTAHVVFGCSTCLVGEALADTWTLFGTSVTIPQFLGFLKIEEHQEIMAKVGWLTASVTVARSVPILVKVAWRAHRMPTKWPWSNFDSFLSRPLADIRRELRIDVVHARN